MLIAKLTLQGIRIHVVAYRHSIWKPVQCAAVMFPLANILFGYMAIIYH